MFFNKMLLPKNDQNMLFPAIWTCMCLRLHIILITTSYNCPLLNY